MSAPLFKQGSDHGRPPGAGRAEEGRVAGVVERVNVDVLVVEEGVGDLRIVVLYGLVERGDAPGHGLVGVRAVGQEQPAKETFQFRGKLMA